MVLKGEKTVAQTTNLWDRNWELYKACRRRENDDPTGGGDPDSEAEPDDDEGSKENKSRPKTKAQRSNNRKYSPRLLDRFASSKIYEMIDAVYALYLVLRYDEHILTVAIAPVHMTARTLPASVHSAHFETSLTLKLSGNPNVRRPKLTARVPTSLMRLSSRL